MSHKPFAPPHEHVRKTDRWILILAFIILLAGSTSSSQAQTIQTIAITQLGPAVCPSAGCAPGQTLNLNASYDFASSNVLVCVFAPTAWEVNAVRFAPSGTISNAPYLPTADSTNCGTPPENYTLAGAVEAGVGTAVGDSLSFSLRLGPASSGNGSITVRTLESAGAPPWTQTNQFFIALTAAPSAATVYVANDAAACGTNTPCYLNSNEDLLNGIGTGLKDAVDSHTSPAVINVLGSYLIKSNTVLIDQPHTIQGLLDAQLTYNGTQCIQPMLTITNGVTLQNLNITAGSCTTPSRDLLMVNSRSPVFIESNDLTGGANAIHIAGGSGNVRLRFNNIQKNSGYAILRDATESALVTAYANNFFNNRSGSQVECNYLSAGLNHNFWGFGINAAAGASHCSSALIPLVEEKRLGAPVLPNPNVPGVSAVQVAVTDSKQYAFNNTVAFQRTSGSDFPVVIVNHGQGGPENVPFTGGMPSSLTSCSNYYDVFLGETATGPTNLDLFFRYDQTPGCTAFVESAEVCGAHDQALVPLWWYDPANAITDGWDTTGQNPAGSGAPASSTGQTTTCLTANKEIQVSLDANPNERPNLAADLNFTPLVIGYRPSPISIVFSGFSADAGNTQATIRWSTASEKDIRGFYVVRSISESGGYERASIFIPRRGTDTSGYAYEFVDAMLTNGQKYYYRIETSTTVNESAYTAAVSVTPAPPTPTPTSTATLTITPNPAYTATPTPTYTATLTPTQTATFTITPTPTITRTPTITPTRTRTTILYPTVVRTSTSIYGVYRSPTPFPTRTLFASRTSTRTLISTQSSSGGSYPVGTSSQAITMSVQSGTPGSTSTITPGGAYPGGAEITVGGTQSTAEAEGSANFETDVALGDVTPEPPLSGRNGLTNWVGRYWPYLLGLLIFEIFVVGICGLILYRKGLLTFPLIRPEPKDDTFGI